MPHTKPHKDIEQHQIINNELAKDITLNLERDPLWNKSLAQAQELADAPRNLTDWTPEMKRQIQKEAMQRFIRGR